jgi:hypothetical protein
MDANEIRSLIIKVFALAAATFYYILIVRRKMKQKRVSYAPHYTKMLNFLGPKPYEVRAKLSEVI